MCAEDAALRLTVDLLLRDARKVLGADDGQLHADAHVVVAAARTNGGKREETLKVALLGSSNQLRQERTDQRIVERAEDHVHDELAVDGHLFGNAGTRMRQAHSRGRRIEQGHERAQARAELWILGAARLVRFAVVHQAIERPLPVARHEQRQTHVGRRHAVEHDRANRGLVLPQVHQRRTCAVGAAVDVDLVVAEVVADVIEIVHRDGRGVETQDRRRAPQGIS